MRKADRRLTACATTPVFSFGVTFSDTQELLLILLPEITPGRPVLEPYGMSGIEPLTPGLAVLLHAKADVQLLCYLSGSNNLKFFIEPFIPARNTPVSDFFPFLLSYCVLYNVFLRFISLCFSQIKNYTLGAKLPLCSNI